MRPELQGEVESELKRMAKDGRRITIQLSGFGAFATITNLQLAARDPRSPPNVRAAAKTVAEMLTAGFEKAPAVRELIEIGWVLSLAVSKR